jgi:hypothetical protein
MPTSITWSRDRAALCPEMEVNTWVTWELFNLKNKFNLLLHNYTN